MGPPRCTWWLPSATASALAGEEFVPQGLVQKRRGVGLALGAGGGGEGYRIDDEHLGYTPKRPTVD